MRNISIKLYPPIENGYVTLIVTDSYGNIANNTFYYAEPSRSVIILEVLIVFSVVLIVMFAILVFTNNK